MLWFAEKQTEFDKGIVRFKEKFGTSPVAVFIDESNKEVLVPDTLERLSLNLPEKHYIFCEDPSELSAPQKKRTLE